MRRLASLAAAAMLGCGGEPTAAPQTGPATGSSGPEGGRTSTGEHETSESDSGSSEDTGRPEPLGSTSTGSDVCGDNQATGDEVCDAADLRGQDCLTQGFEAGTLACAADCLALDTARCRTCGNAQLEGGEVCERSMLGAETCATQGFDSGTLACGDGCDAFDTRGCGLCGNGGLDGDEVCDGADLGGEQCSEHGFDGGVLACGAECTAVDVSGCTICGDGVVDPGEDCDGANVGGQTCRSLAAGFGELACGPDCQYDPASCIATQQYDVSAPNTSALQDSYFRGHGYEADGDGVLVDFEVYLGLAAACDLDFYVFEAPAFGGPYTLRQRTTVNAGPGTGYWAAGMTGLDIDGGAYYVTGVGWNCEATYYWDATGAFAGVDAGIGIYDVRHMDNAYPGASDLYVPPDVASGNTAYVHRVFFAD